MNDVNSKPTPGPWITQPCGGLLPDDVMIVADCGLLPNGIQQISTVARALSVRQTREVTAANARLIAEAGTVHHETGLTPQQMREQRDKLLVVLKALAKEHHDILASGDCGCTDPAKCDELIAANTAIAKVEQSK